MQHLHTLHFKLLKDKKESTKIVQAALDFSFTSVPLTKLMISHVSLIKRHYTRFVGRNKFFM